MSRPVFDRSARAFVEDALEPFNPVLKLVVRSALFRTGADVTDASARPVVPGAGASPRRRDARCRSDHHA